MRCSRPAWRSASRIAATIAGVDEMHGGSPTPLAPSGACGSGSSISVATTVGHVEHRRQQVVGEAGVADPPVDLDDLLHHRQPEALGDAALDLAEHRQRVERPPDVLGGGDLHHLHQPELGVDVDHGAVGDEGERRVAVALAVLVEVLGRAVVVLDGLVEGAARRWPRRPARAARRSTSTTSVPSIDERSGSTPCAAPTCSNSRSRTARQAASTAPPLIHVWRDADVEPAEPIVGVDRSSTTSSTPSIDAGDLRRRCVTKPWPTSAVANFSVATPSAQPAPRRRVVVEALGVHQVLDRHAPADAAHDVAGVGGAAGAAGQAHRVAVGAADRLGRAAAARRSRGCTAPPAPRSRPPGR